MVVLSVVATSVLIVISFLAVDPRLTIHHSGWRGKRVERSEEKIECKALEGLEDSNLRERGLPGTEIRFHLLPIVNVKSVSDIRMV